MSEPMYLSEKDLYCIKDKSRRLEIKKMLQLNNIIRNTIDISTYKVKNSKNKYQKLNQLLKQNSLYNNVINDNNRNLLDKMPYLIFGIVESIFVDEEKNEKTKEYGCAILIDSNVILLPSKNLIFDNQSFENESLNIEEENNEEEKNNKENNTNSNNNQNNNDNNSKKYNFKLFEVNFKPLNISPENRAYIPKSIKVIDHYSPLNDTNIYNNENEFNSTSTSNKHINENVENNEDAPENNENSEDKLCNCWGLAFLEYPLGDIINYLYNKENIYPSYLKGGYKKENQNKKVFLFDNIFIKNLSNDELEKSEIHFLECFPTQDSNVLNTNNSEDLDSNNYYEFRENYYDMNFDTKLIYLNNPFNDQKTDEDVLPGFIIGKFLDKYYLLGMNTNTMIKFSIDENNNNEQENKNNNNIIKEEKKESNIDENNNNENEKNQNENNQENNNQEDNKENTNNNNPNSPIYHIAIRFTKDLSELIYNKINEFKERYPNKFEFNDKVFEIFCKKIPNKNVLLNLLKNNCDGLYKLLNNIREDKTLNLSNNLKKNFMLNYGINLNSIPFYLMMLYNKYSSSIIESKIIDIENLKIGYFPGSTILSEIIQSKDSIMTLNLRNNLLYSKGIKEIMNPIFNKKKILDLGKDLKCLCLDWNKLDGKALKYLRYLLKVSPQIALINLSNNYINGESLKHLIHCSANKSFLEIFYINNNLLGENCGESLGKILHNFNNLKELNLSCNCIGDGPVKNVLNTLKENNKIEILFLSNNNITDASSEIIASFLSNNHTLKTFWLNNNNLNSNGINKISQALSTKLVLEEINLNSVNMLDEGGKELFENLKLNKSLRRIYLNSNRLQKNFCLKLNEYLKIMNDNEKCEGGIEILSLSGNNITDECINLFVEELMKYKWIKEIKLNSNFISDEGGELILYAVLQNMSINKVNLENNQTTWEINNENFKSFRDDIQIYF